MLCIILAPVTKLCHPNFVPFQTFCLFHPSSFSSKQTHNSSNKIHMHHSSIVVGISPPVADRHSISNRCRCDLSHSSSSLHTSFVDLPSHLSSFTLSLCEQAGQPAPALLSSLLPFTHTLYLLPAGSRLFFAQPLQLITFAFGHSSFSFFYISASISLRNSIHCLFVSVRVRFLHLQPSSVSSSFCFLVSFNKPCRLLENFNFSPWSLPS